MAKLRTKQKLFIQEYVKTNGNGQKAALRVYDTKSANVAANIASENLNKPNIKEELDKILNKGRLKLDLVTDKLADIVAQNPTKGYSGSEIMDAIKTTLKLHGVLTDRKQVTSYNMNVNYNEMSQHELVELRKKKQQETDDILAPDTSTNK